MTMAFPATPKHEKSMVCELSPSKKRSLRFRAEAEARGKQKQLQEKKDMMRTIQNLQKVRKTERFLFFWKQSLKPCQDCRSRRELYQQQTKRTSRQNQIVFIKQMLKCSSNAFRSCTVAQISTATPRSTRIKENMKIRFPSGCFKLLRFIYPLVFKRS